MYKKILVALENSRTDESLLPHIEKLAALTHAELLLVHVADGWVARHFDQLQLRESEEMTSDRAYLEKAAENLRASGLKVSVRLALGDPPREILKTAEEEHCDLIAMTTHGHRLIADIILGSTIDHVRHHALVPLLVVRGTAR
ncbi:MAG: universal stress protein [Verrucomicrobia bacterium]|nr:universal stress protein [Verrucomicrobiota bacterium]